MPAAGDTFEIADSVRTMISYPWRTGAYRSSSSAYCRRLIERFGVALPVISLGLQGSGLQDRRLLKRAFGRPQTWSHCRIRPYMRIKAAPAAPLARLPRRALPWGGPPGAAGPQLQGTQIEVAHTSQQRVAHVSRLPCTRLSSSRPPPQGALRASRRVSADARNA